MSESELQQEELEVLKSIYDGDELFKIVDDTTFQCKIGQDNKTFLLEIHWPSSYPNKNPDINLELFYNKHISKDIKNSILQQLKAEAELNAGTAMTYTLFEWAKENYENLLVNQPESPLVMADVIDSLKDLDTQDTVSNENKIGAIKKEKKVQLTKSQKRKLHDRLDTKGERPRGWDWVDIVKHLSQTGGSSAAKQVENLE